MVASRPRHAYWYMLLIGAMNWACAFRCSWLYSCSCFVFCVPILLRLTMPGKWASYNSVQGCLYTAVYFSVQLWFCDRICEFRDVQNAWRGRGSSGPTFTLHQPLYLQYAQGLLSNVALTNAPPVEMSDLPGLLQYHIHFQTVLDILKSKCIAVWSDLYLPVVLQV